jgi:uncharacterized tellurite resistance protein B-like protein
MTATLPKDSFLLLAAIGWADGKLDREEAKALLKAAEGSGLTGADLGAVDQATRIPVALGDIDSSRLSPWERLLTYSLGVWIARVDGVVTGDEEKSLRALATVLELPFPIQVRATDAVLDVARRKPAERPEKYDFSALAAELKKKLPHLAPHE